MKSILRGLLFLTAVLIIFSVVAFALPFARTELFWIGYGFGVFSILCEWVIFGISFSAGANARSRFYGFPIVKMGAYYAVAQVGLSILEMVLSESVLFEVFLPLNILLLAFAMIGCVTVDAVRDEIERQERDLRGNVSGMRQLQIASAALVGQCDDEAMRRTLRKMADEIRFSDPVSSDDTRAIEEDMRRRLDDIRQALADGDMDRAEGLCAELTGRLEERNRICAMNKQQSRRG